MLLVAQNIWYINAHSNNNNAEYYKYNKVCVLRKMKQNTKSSISFYRMNLLPKRFTHGGWISNYNSIEVLFIKLTLISKFLKFFKFILNSLCKISNNQKKYILARYFRWH